MLTIRHNKRRRWNEAIITLPDCSTQDRLRFAALARAFFGRYDADAIAYIFTEACGRKCWTLFQAGFSAVPRVSKYNNYFITHPDFKRKLPVCHALKLAHEILTPAI